MKRERRIWRNGFGAGLLTAGLIVSAILARVAKMLKGEKDE